MFWDKRADKIFNKVFFYDDGADAGTFGGGGTGDADNATDGDDGGFGGVGDGVPDFTGLTVSNPTVSAEQNDAQMDAIAALAAQDSNTGKFINTLLAFLPLDNVFEAIFEGNNNLTMGENAAIALAKGQLATGITGQITNGNQSANIDGMSDQELIKIGQQYAEENDINIDDMVNGIETNLQAEALGIPSGLMPGINDYVERSEDITDNYNTKANSLWNDYLEFEKVYFDKYEDVQNTYQDNLSSIPKMNMTMPDTMGGGTVPLAPKVHTAMYGDQANTMSNLIGNQGNTALAGMSSRNAINNNQFNVNQAGLQNSFMPTQTGLDLYKMERAGELNINAIHEGKQDDPSTWSAWAPVVGSLLSSSPSGKTNMESAYDFISKAWE